MTDAATNWRGSLRRAACGEPGSATPPTPPSPPSSLLPPPGTPSSPPPPPLTSLSNSGSALSSSTKPPPLSPPPPPPSSASTLPSFNCTPTTSTSPSTTTTPRSTKPYLLLLLLLLLLPISLTFFSYMQNQSKNTGSRYVDSELPESWYNQVIHKYKPTNNNLASGESRSPAEMASYLAYATNHKKRRIAFKEDANSVTESANLPLDDDSVVFPEIAFALNCVPDSALSVSDRAESNSHKPVKVLSVLDTLPPVTSRSSVMVDRLGVSVDHGRNGRVIGPQQAAKLAQKATARILFGVGFEGAMEGSVEDFSEVLSERISKIGTNLRVLADSYKKQCSAIELLKMLLKTVGFSSFAPLVDVVRDGSKNIVQQSQQVHGMQPQMQQQQQGSLRLPQQIQMQRQMQQIIHSQNMAFQQQQQQQQQLERMRRRQASTPRPAMDIDKERPLVQVKIENQDLPNDGNGFTSRHPQMQFRQQQQQQMAAMSNFHSQSGTQFRQMSSLQIPSIQSPNIGMVRAPPVKVEGFSELMGGGDSTTKHDLEENRLTSPNGK
ncbi:hypothetical protein Fmac_002995 [Flemingia macrophylla]|uniref:Uncharacterized protein n=1 Tax=Flemingia macrophylla TaxID=520843 RepID=A0ABD1NPE9_9FABA